MKNTERLLYGIAITTAIVFAAILLSPLIKIDNAFIANIFKQNTILLCLSVVAILLMKKHLTYSIAIPKFKLVLRPVVLTLMTYVGFSLFSGFMTRLCGAPVGEVHPAIGKLNPLQYLLFVFIYTSFAEEVLFRGFLLNLLAPLKHKGIKILNRKLSLPVMISAIVFGLAHLSLLHYGLSSFFMIRIVIFTSCIGLIAGYYQEKHNNNAYAIVVHMTSNLFGLLPVIMLA